MPISPKSSTGKRAHAPRWWGVIIDFLPQLTISLLHPKVWTRELAERWIDSIPAKCPFERQLWYGNKLIMYIPPLCPFNPLSKQLYSIRLEAQTYLMSVSDRA
jgi:hypothetical protein